MSWDPYLDNLVERSKDPNGGYHIQKACIIGLNGGAAWTSPGHPQALQISEAEARAIAQCMQSKNFSVFMASGVRIGGQKYQFLRETDGKAVFAKAKDKGSISIQSSKTAIVIAFCPEGKQQGNANKAVDAIADYLESVGI